VPKLLILAEFYEPNADSSTRNRLESDLVVAVRYLERSGLIERHEVADGDTMIWPGLAVPAISSVGYARPDGRFVGTIFEVAVDLDALPRAIVPLGADPIRRQLGISDRSRCVLLGLVVDKHPVYTSFHAFSPDGRGFDATRGVFYTLGTPDTVSGFPRNENYSVTPAGVALIERGASTGHRERRATQRSVGGYASADTIHLKHGIRRERLSEGKRQGAIRSMPALPGTVDSQGKDVRVLYNVEDAIKHCSPKRKRERRSRSNDIGNG
jgi:hypothetical protein